MIKDKFSLSMKKPQDVVVKNTIKDTLNPNYRNTINRITQIDSQYRNSLLQSNNNSLCSDTYLNIQPFCYVSQAIYFNFLIYQDFA